MADASELLAQRGVTGFQGGKTGWRHTGRQDENAGLVK
jgi:hypothetical protein